MCKKRLRVVTCGKQSKRYQLLDDKSGQLQDANQFLDAQSIRGLSERTVRAYAFDLLIVYRWLQQTQKKLQSLKQADLLEFVADQRRKKAQPRSINRRLTTFRQLYRFVTTKDLDAGFGTSMPAPSYRRPKVDQKLGLIKIKLAPWQKLKVKVPHTLIDPLTQKQVLRFLGTLRRYRDLAIVHLMLLCGLRSKEVMHLAIKDVSLLQKQIRVFGKRQKERMLPLPDLLIQILVDYLRYERPTRSRTHALFVVLQGKRRGLPMTLEGLRSLFRHRRLDKKLAVANPHRFRHTFGTNMARAGVRLPVLQKLMGHAFSQTTLQYINLSLEDIADEYQKAMREIQKRYE
ncbi:MAG: tyrosine-type recombinase/integrase [Pseudomonadota bacterium]